MHIKNGVDNSTTLFGEKETDLFFMLFLIECVVIQYV